LPEILFTSLAESAHEKILAFTTEVKSKSGDTKGAFIANEDTFVSFDPNGRFLVMVSCTDFDSGQYISYAYGIKVVKK
jgi:hypothetical protein